MKFLKRNKVLSEARIADELIRCYAQSEISVIPATADDLAQAQKSITNLSFELQTHVNAQKFVAKRMRNLKKTIDRLQQRLRQLEKVEVDNQKLAKTLEALSEKYRQKTDFSEAQEQALSELKGECHDLRENALVMETSLKNFKDRDTLSRKALLRQSRELEALKTNLFQKEEALQTSTSSRQNMEETLAQTKEDLSSEHNRALELQAVTDELASRLTDKTRSCYNAETELKNIQLRYNQQKETLFALQSDVQTLSSALKSQKKDHNEALKRSEDEITALRNQNERLSTELRIKENMTAHFDEELSGLRAALDAERNRAARESTALLSKTEALEDHNRALAESKAEYEQLQAKFSAALEDLDAFRKLCSIQKQKLERYAAISDAATEKISDSQGSESFLYKSKTRLKAV